MKLQARKRDILDVLSVVDRAVSTKSPIPVTHGLHIEASSGKLCLTTNNLEIAIKGTAPATVIEHGSTVVPPSFCQIIRNLDEDVEIAIEDIIAPHSSEFIQELGANR